MWDYNCGYVTPPIIRKLQPAHSSSLLISAPCLRLLEDKSSFTWYNNTGGLTRGTNHVIRMSRVIQDRVRHARRKLYGAVRNTSACIGGLSARREP